MPSTVNLIIKSIEHIRRIQRNAIGIAFIPFYENRNGISAVYGDVTQQLLELNTAVGLDYFFSQQAAKKLSHFVVVPRVVGDSDG